MSTTQTDHRAYWQAYKRRKRRVSLTLDPLDYSQLCDRAAGHQPPRTPGQQLWLEATAYRRQRYLPSATIQPRLDQLLQATRQLSSALQMGATPHPLGSDAEALRAQIRFLHQQLRRFVQGPHDH